MWTYVSEKPNNIKAHLESILTFNGKKFKNEVLVSEIINKVMYAGVKITTLNNRNNYISCYIIEFDSRKDMFGYRIDVDVSSHCDCPEYILDMLSPLDINDKDFNYSSMIDWRKKCRETISENKLIKSIRIGDKIKFGKKMFFKYNNEYFEGNEFMLVGKDKYVLNDSTVYFSINYLKKCLGSFYKD